MRHAQVLIVFTCALSPREQSQPLGDRWKVSVMPHWLLGRPHGSVSITTWLITR